MHTKTVQKKSRKPYLLGAGVLAAILLIGGTFLIVSHHGKQNAKSVSLSANQSSNATKQSNANLPATSGSTSTTNSLQGGTGSAKSPDTLQPASGAAPKTPSGQFVSSHTAQISASGFTPNTEDSVCNTSPGATCDITFTQNGTTKSLGQKKTDSSGAAYWSGWTVGSYLTAGTWKITATATLNGQTASATDPTNLVVSQ